MASDDYDSSTDVQDDLPLTSQQELRMRCAEAAAKAVSGIPFYQPESSFLGLARSIENYVKDG